MGPLMGGMMLQPAVGWMLDQRWQGGLEAGVKVFDAAAYQAGFTLIFVAVVLASGLIFFGRESFCRQMT